MADTVNNIVRDNYDVKSQIGDLPEVITAVKRYNPSLRIKRKYTKQYVLSTGTSFVLGSSTNGVLGVNKLGDRRIELDNFVFPYRDIVEEDLVDLSFINESETTANVKVD